MSWKQSDCKLVDVDCVMEDLAQLRQIPNRGGIQLGSGNGRIVGSTGEVVVQKYLKKYYRRFNGIQHDMRFLEHKSEIKTMTTSKDYPSEYYGTDVGYHMQVDRESKRSDSARKIIPDWDIMIFVNLPDHRRQGIVTGYVTKEEFENYKLWFPKGSGNGYIKDLKEDNWGFPYYRMRPIKELVEHLESSMTEENILNKVRARDFSHDKPDSKPRPKSFDIMEETKNKMSLYMKE